MVARRMGNKQMATSTMASRTRAKSPADRKLATQDRSFDASSHRALADHHRALAGHHAAQAKAKTSKGAKSRRGY